MPGKDEFHLEGDDVKTMVLALCVLEAMFDRFPLIINEFAAMEGFPELAALACRAHDLRRRMAQG